MLRRVLAAAVLAGLSSPVCAQPVDLSLNAVAVFYGDNTEFFNPFRRGETTLGTHGTLFVEARASGRLTLRAGAFGNWRLGSDAGVDVVRPVLTLVVGPPRSRLLLGTIESTRQRDGPGPDRAGPHALLPPLQVETLAFDRPLEAGLQWLVHTSAVSQDAWINWQRVGSASRRERFDTGVTTRVRLGAATALRGQAHLVHEGGQQGGPGPVTDSLAVALGFEAGGAIGRFDRVALEWFVLGSRVVPDRERLQTARNGAGSFLRVSAERSGWRGHGILWRGNDFLASEGDTNYHGIRLDGTSFRAVRDYAEAGLTRTFALAPASGLEASFRLHRIERDIEYLFRIVAVARLRI